MDEFGNFKLGYQWFVYGDTTINSKKYSILVDVIDSSLTITPPFHWRGIRNDTVNKKVFMFDVSSNKEKLLYDFSLNIGDTIPLSWGGDAHYYRRVITDIKTIVIKGNNHLQFEVDNNTVSPYIEGIGSLNGPFETPYFFEGGSELVCTMIGNVLTPYFSPFGGKCELYHSTGIKPISFGSDQIRIYPNPITDNSIIEILNKNEFIEEVTLIDNIGNLQVIDSPSKVLQIGQHIHIPGIYTIYIRFRSNKVFIDRILKI